MSFQVAALWEADAALAGSARIRVEVDTPTDLDACISSVELVPVEYPAPPGAEAGYLQTRPGLYPDLLMPASERGVTAAVGQWRAFWIDLIVEPFAAPLAGAVPVRVYGGDQIIAELSIPVLVVGATLPELEIPNTHWFHCDGLANYYGFEVFGDEHWAAIDHFLGAARGISANTILTPVWTPPLDTAVDHYRTATQLIVITDVGQDEYVFDFTALRRWMERCRAHGFQYLEIAHLFTQWGAKATPAIHVQTDAGLERRFGWHVAATDPRYRRFLEQMIPELRTLLTTEWGLENVFFHISDEPTPEDFDGYAAARAVVSDLLEGCTIVDAISDFGLYKRGVVPEPVAATDHAAAFFDAGVRPWLYYCVAQDTNVSNRFIALPSPRNRVIGAQLFKFEARGFLHWGFNFYNAAKSLTTIDPFTDTCANRAFPGGDPFLVYPGPGGQPLPSIRYRVFAEAMGDLRAMQVVRDHHGAARVRKIIDPDGSLALDAFPNDAVHYRRVFHQLALAVQEFTEA
ncbi:glycoside hydrolase domain-containing protein [Agromyces italicus]|uniref:glycoside hydrolase domain-containing protein n=1 Tax=Agromyces italicus TaxID=279572 RepID=UPI0012F760F3